MKRKSIDKVASSGEAQSLAIDWQTSWQENQYSYSEIIDWQEYFTELAKKFNLTDEFRENGII